MGSGVNARKSYISASKPAVPVNVNPKINAPNTTPIPTPAPINPINIIFGPLGPDPTALGPALRGHAKYMYAQLKERPFFFCRGAVDYFLRNP
jgi:hypothetical protein